MLVLGIDEAGRGPVVGPMVIAGVLCSESAEKKLRELGARDSKQLSAKKREQLVSGIKKLSEEVRFVEIFATEIDARRKRMSLNELEALKMAELIEMFKKKPDRVVIDLPDPTAAHLTRRLRKYLTIDFDLVAEHKADVNHPCVSAASIIAKVERDWHVRQIEKKHGIKLGTGYSHDPATIAFLKNHDGEFPDFVRKSWDTAIQISNLKKQRKLADF